MFPCKSSFGGRWSKQLPPATPLHIERPQGFELCCEIYLCMSMYMYCICLCICRCICVCICICICVCICMCIWTFWGQSDSIRASWDNLGQSEPPGINMGQSGVPGASLGQSGEVHNTARAHACAYDFLYSNIGSRTISCPTCRSKRPKNRP